MRFSVLSSGSKANATYIECGETRILIDCGLSARTMEQRMAQMGIDPDSIDAILITHEHSDHIRGVERFSKRHELPVYVNAATRRFVSGAYATELFETGVSFSIGAVEISPVSTVHDAVDPVGYIICSGGMRFAQVTDLGKVTPLIREAVRGCHALVIESNHDPEMLWSCSYPWELKQRISSSHGHLSNAATGELLNEVRHGDLLHVVLAHISENSNTPDMAHKTAKQFLGEDARCSLSCGSVHHPLPLMAVGE